ncbi:MAG: heat-inducible transcription repressor HrcA [Myxococcales bacterium]|nr:heat-inducible transcription repressor HrcA [Myxococcales bacterium]
MSQEPSGELSFRARRILYAVVTEYVATGEPVGSRKLARRYELQLSPASIRNVLADLEESGYLAQPHTSAGRIPTDRGFRLFVDALVHMREVSADERAAIASRLKAIRPEEQNLMRETAELLSSLTDTAAILAPPRARDDRLSQLRFVQIKPDRVLAVLVTEGETVQNRLVDLQEPLEPRDLERIHNYLDELVSGRTLSEIREALAGEVADERGDYDVLRRLTQNVVEAAMVDGETAISVVIEGQGRLFDRPEFRDSEKIRGFVRAFEEKQTLLHLLDGTLRAGGVQVLIGAETHLSDVNDIGLISANYRRRGGPPGSVGIVGPARMDYGKLVPLVEFTARMMSEALEGDSGSGRPDSDPPEEPDPPSREGESEEPEGSY